ncbi:MAG: flagellar export protein FliJ [Pyrinomonadaceae bacterium]
MKKFKFTLDSVHKVREIKQDRESVILSELQAEADRAAERVAHIEAMRHDAIENYTRRIAAGERLDALEMELSSKHFASLDQIQKAAEANLAQRQVACEIQIAAVTDAMRNVKITENLRETQRERHNAEFERREQNGVDELVSNKFARRILEAK